MGYAMTTNRTAADLAADLGRNAEAVCARYLSNGRRQGNHWIVGDLSNNPGGSLYVRLSAQQGAAGKWTDAATGEHGDLLDLIQHVCGLLSVREAMEEARAFLALPPVERPAERPPAPKPALRSSPESARRLFRAAWPIPGTPAATYLARRGLTGIDGAALRFHPACYYKPLDDGPTESWPALLAAITDIDGEIQGVHRTWLARSGEEKAPVSDPRRSMGHQLGNGVRISGVPEHLLVVGEGLETVLSVRAALPRVPAVAGLSANHLAVLALPPGVIRLYVAHDADADGRRAVEALRARAPGAGIPDVRALSPVHDDFNTDLQRLGLAGLAEHLAGQIAPEDREWLYQAPVEQAARVA